MPPNPRADVNLSDNSVVDKEPPDNIDKDNKDYSNINNQDLTMAYNKAIGGREEVLLLNILNMWRDNSEVLTGTHLDVFSKESSKEIKVASLEEPVKY